MSIIANASTPSITLVIGMGLGIVFIGLICIIILCYLMSTVVRALQNNKETEAPVVNTAPPAAVSAQAPIENRQELIAAVSAVIAEELGTDVSAIRIKSIKKV